jgi:hypothetical protein
MDNELRTLQKLMHKYGYFGQASAIAEIRGARARGDETAFREQVAGWAIWGREGSVADADLRTMGPPGSSQARADLRDYYQAMIALAESLDELGIGSDRTRQIAASFAKQLPAYQ